MKKLIIIDTYPINTQFEDILDECIDRLVNRGFDIMIVSHDHVNECIADKVNYSLYDKENILLPYELTPYWWMDNDTFSVTIHDRGHSITICKNMFTSVSIAKALGYDFFYFIESDNLFSYNDIVKLSVLSDEMFEAEKRMIFFKQEHDGEEFIYETLIFGGEPDYFLSNMDLPKSVDEYVEMGMSPTLEGSFYNKLSGKESEFIIINQTTSEYFNESIINKFSQNSHKCEMLKYVGGYMLFIVNDARNSVDISVEVGEEQFTLQVGGWFFKSFSEDHEGDIEVFINDGGYYDNKVFNLENKKDYDERGIFEFRTN